MWHRQKYWSNSKSNGKFMTFNIGDVRFIDGLQCMASALETLADNLITPSTNNYAMFEMMTNILTLMS